MLSRAFPLSKYYREPFTGKVELFWYRKSIITTRLLEIGASPIDELHILKDNTKGRSHEIIDMFMIISIDSPEKKRYVESEKIKKKRYASDDKLTTHLFGQLEVFPNFKIPHHVTDLETLRCICRNMKVHADYGTSLTPMNSPQCQKLIWERMPDQFINRWRRKPANRLFPLVQDL